MVRENTEDLYAGVEHYIDPPPHGRRVDRDHHEVRQRARHHLCVRVREAHHAASA